VLPASSPEDALGLAASHTGPLHLLLTDVIMPGMSGPELARRLAAERPDLAILFMSGYTDGSVAPHGVLEPGIQFIQKPFDRSSLLQKIRATLVNKSESAG
jgi:FixJ family two-component response regulator